MRQNILAYELRPMLLSLTSEILRHSLGFIKLLAGISDEIAP